MKNPIFRTDFSSRRVERGGGWYSLAQDLRVSYRSGDEPTNTGYDLGFRVFRTKEKA